MKHCLNCDRDYEDALARCPHCSADGAGAPCPFCQGNKDDCLYCAPDRRYPRISQQPPPREEWLPQQPREPEPEPEPLSPAQKIQRRLQENQAHPPVPVPARPYSPALVAVLLILLPPVGLAMLWSRRTRLRTIWKAALSALFGSIFLFALVAILPEAAATNVLIAAALVLVPFIAIIAILRNKNERYKILKIISAVVLALIIVFGICVILFAD